MKSISIFISSPGDVGKERHTASRVIERLQHEFADRAALEPYFWEYEPMQATKDFQENIPSTAQFDILVCILWSRLGTRLGAKYRCSDGSYYQSGTEYELATAIESFQTSGKPEILVYLNKTEPKFPVKPKEVLARMVDQYYKLEDFLNQLFYDSTEGLWKAALNEYMSLAEFEDRLEKHLRSLIIKGLPEIGPGKPKREATWKGSPFRGLRTFDYEHAPIFFGRTRAIDQVLTALRKQSLDGRAFLLVLGMSGVGKSSLVRAGVLPLMIKPGVMEGIGLWRRALMCPSDASGDLFLALSASLLKSEALPELASDSMSSQDLAVHLQKNPEGVCLMIRQALTQAAEKKMIHEEQDLRDMIKEMDQECRAADVASLGRRLVDLKPTQARLVLIIDQMEEMFTQDLTPQQRQEFIHAISIIARSGQVFVIATLRSDFYPRCMDLPEILDLKKGEGLYDLEKPTPEEIGQMIREPAIAAGVQFQVDTQNKQTLDEVLRDSAIKDPSILPLLEFMLEQLFEQRTQGGELAFQAYKTLGGIEGAVTKRAEEVFGMLTPKGQQAFNRIMRGLVTPGLIDEDTFNRRWALYDKLTSTPGAKAFVNAFIQARLFMADKNERGEPVVSVSHEALINRWPRLRQWVEENQEFLRIRARVSQAATRWRQEKELPDLLLPSGKPLAEAQNILIDYREDLELELIRFIEISSKQEQDRHLRQVRRARNVAIVMGVLFILAVIGAIFAFVQFRQARTQEQIAKSTLANSYFLQGTRLVEEDNADQALSFFAQAVRLAGHKASATRIATLLTQRNWLLSKGEPMRHEGGVRSARFSRDGTRVVTASLDGSARVWDAATGKPVSDPMRHKAIVNSARFSLDGRWVVTASWDGTARIWEISPVQDPPMWLADLAEVWGGWQVNDFGRVVTTANRDKLLEEIRSKLSRLPEDDAWAKMARWCFADRSSRTISPNATITVPEYVLRRIEENSISSLNDALDLDPGNPLALARLGRLRLDQSESQNLYGKNQADVLTALAARLAPDNAEVLYLRGEVLQHIGRPAEALQAFTKAHELNETFKIPNISEGLITSNP